MESKEVKIKIHGREYPCMITLGAFLRYNHETGKDTPEIAGNDITAMVTFLWCCTASTCNDKKVDFDISLMDFADALTLDQLEECKSNLEMSEKKTVSSRA